MKTTGANRLEEMYSLSRVIANSVHFGEHNDENMLAQDILDASYGNIKEFCTRLDDELENMAMEASGQYNDGYNDCIFDVRGLLDTLITELYGADE